MRNEAKGDFERIFHDSGVEFANFNDNDNTNKKSEQPA